MDTENGELGRGLRVLAGSEHDERSNSEAKHRNRRAIVRLLCQGSKKTQLRVPVDLPILPLSAIHTTVHRSVPALSQSATEIR